VSVILFTTHHITLVPEKSDSGIDAEIIDDLANLYHPRHHYGCGGAKTPYCLIKIGGRQLRLYAFHYPSFSITTNRKKPSSKTLSFIDIREKQLLRKWTLKAALIITIQVRQIKFIHILVLIYTDSYMFIIHRSQIRDEFSTASVTCDASKSSLTKNL